MNREETDIDLSFIENDYFGKLLEDYLEKIMQLPLKIRGVLLFGSLATGKALYSGQKISDIDIIIISDELPKDIWKRKEKIHELINEYFPEVQDIWWTSEEIRNHVLNKYYLILDALDEGRILYDPSNLLHSLKKQLFLDLAKKGVIKKDLYWQWPISKFGDKIEYFSLIKSV
jgi:predicted nucleotidyltransferase